MSTKNITKAELEAEIIALKAQLAAQTANQVVNTTTANPSTDVTIVYCSDSLGFAKISNMELNFNRFGEEFILSRSQFDELVGKYRSWFERGTLAVSYKNTDVAISKGLRTDKEYAITYTVLESIGTMGVNQLENLWNSVKIPSHRGSIVTFYKRNFIDNVPGYRDMAKVDLMNRLTNGGFDRERDELVGRYHIDPTEM